MTKSVDELITKLSTEKFEGKKIEWASTYLGGTIEVKYAHDKENNYIIKDKVIYVKRIDNTGDMTCFGCGSDILSATVTRSIWDGPFKMSGSGKVQKEEVPYCPKCEEKPSYHGSPIQLKSILA